MRVRVGHTPDSDDAFMFYGMLTGRVSSPDFEVEHVIEDIEGLNRRAKDPDLDVTAVSVHACAYIGGYTVLRSGGSFGLGYGPIVAAREGATWEDVRGGTVAIPGRMTSAFLLLQLMAGGFRHVEVGFSEIPAAVRDGRADAGLVIHEAQLSYGSEGVSKVLDVGRWWHEETGGLPVPLGINVMRTALGDGAIRGFDGLLRDSIRYGLGHAGEALDYAMRYSRGKPRDLIERFVRMYVNDATVDMGEAGEESIRRLFAMARGRGLVPEFELRIAS